VAKKSSKQPKVEKEVEDAPKVTRIKANDSKPKAKKAVKAKIVTEIKPKKPTKNPLVSLIGYFKGAWYELTQVHWPNRRATWGLTGAVLVFTAFFVILILLLDILFKYLFEQILG